MNSKKIFTVFSILMYISTAQLGIRTFAIHGNIEGHHQEVIKSDSNRIHEEGADTYNQQDEIIYHDHSGVMMCTSTGDGALMSSNFSLRSIKVINIVPHIFQYTSLKSMINKYFSLREDPGGGNGYSFAKFLSTHYGSIIMHC